MNRLMLLSFAALRRLKVPRTLVLKSSLGFHMVAATSAKAASWKIMSASFMALWTVGSCFMSPIMISMSSCCWMPKWVSWLKGYAERLSRILTVAPCWVSFFAMWLPMRPAPPVTSAVLLLHFRLIRLRVSF